MFFQYLWQFKGIFLEYRGYRKFIDSISWVSYPLIDQMVKNKSVEIAPYSFGNLYIDHFAILVEKICIQIRNQRMIQVIISACSQFKEIDNLTKLSSVKVIKF